LGVTRAADDPPSARMENRGVAVALETIKQRELFVGPPVIFLMAWKQPRRKKNELRDALLVSLTLAVTMFALAMFASAHL
jgi:hypothetical protein